MTNAKLATVLFSGGIDSMCCAHFLRTRGFAVSGLFVDYGQAAVQFEKRACDTLSDAMEFSLHSVSCRGQKDFGSGEVLGRNHLLISLGLVYSQMPTGILAIGIHAGTDYFDCSEHFFNAASALVTNQSDGKIELVAPFLTWQKADIYRYAINSDLPVESSYSCESGGLPPCGGCLSCQDREALRALRKNV